jgi:hypothetical protein
MQGTPSIGGGHSTIWSKLTTFKISDILMGWFVASAMEVGVGEGASISAKVSIPSIL